MAFKVHVNETQRSAATSSLLPTSIILLSVSCRHLPSLLYVCACTEHHHSLPWVRL